VTTEDDFRRALDAHPEDWQTMLVFADWLEERGDVRADGYRALGALRFVPRDEPSPVYLYGVWSAAARTSSRVYTLPTDWFGLIGGDYRPYPPHGDAKSKDFRNPSALFDAAALAFARLPDAHRAELLDAGGRGV
jgi:uncharacterized protein (TIGR02996 family)